MDTHSDLVSSNFLITRAGEPTAIEFAGISLDTTLIAPIIAPSPIVIPGKIATYSPIQTFLPMVTFLGFKIRAVGFSLGLLCISPA